MSLREEILAWWRARQRAIDIAILWPICVERAPNIDRAKAAFALHAFNDPAWLALGEDELIRRIEAMPGGV